MKEFKFFVGYVDSTIELWNTTMPYIRSLAALELIANDLVRVVPLSRPNSTLFYLDYNYDTDRLNNWTSEE